MKFCLCRSKKDFDPGVYFSNKSEYNEHDWDPKGHCKALLIDTQTVIVQGGGQTDVNINLID